MRLLPTTFVSSSRSQLSTHMLVLLGSLAGPSVYACLSKQTLPIVANQPNNVRKLLKANTQGV